MALTKVTGQVINSTTNLSVGVATVGGGTSTGDLYVVGVSTLVGDLSLSGNVSIGGTLTYEDVTNVDSVGLITARKGISVSGGDVKVGSALTISQDGNLYTTGIATIYNGFSGGAASNVDSAIVLDNDSHSYVQFRTPANKEQGLLFGDDADNDAGAITYVHSTNHIGFRVNASERARIDSSGNVNLGAAAANTAIQASGPFSGATPKLEIKLGSSSNSYTRLINIANPGAQTGSESLGRVGIKLSLGSEASSGETNKSGIIYAESTSTYNNGTALCFATNGSERFRVDSSGRVGISTLNPQVLLDIVDTPVANSDRNGDDKLTIEHAGTTNINLISAANNSCFLLFSDDTRAQGYVKYDHNLDDLCLSATDDTWFRNNGTERLRIASNGNVSIGNNPTVAADTIFHVEKTSGECNVYFEGDTSTLGARLILKNNNTAAGAMNAITFADAGGQSTCGIDAYNYDQTNNRGYLSFTTREGAGAAPINRMTINRCPTMEVGIVTATGAFCGTVNKAYKYTQPSPGNQNIPYDTWSTISTSYGWALPSAGTYKLTSGNRVRLWEVAGYIQTRLWDNTDSNAIADTLRMMFEQGNNSAPMGRYNVQINLVWVITIPTARTVYQQYNTNNNSTYSSIQDDVNGRNYYLWERIG